MWHRRFNLGIESNGKTLGSLKEDQEQIGLLLAFLFVQVIRFGRAVRVPADELKQWVREYRYKQSA
jgi:hypothetical protein